MSNLSAQIDAPVAALASEGYWRLPGEEKLGKDAAQVLGSGAAYFADDAVPVHDDVRRDTLDAQCRGIRGVLVNEDRVREIEPLAVAWKVRPGIGVLPDVDPDDLDADRGGALANFLE